MTNSCTLHGYPRFFQNTGTLNFCRQKLSRVCHQLINIWTLCVYSPLLHCHFQVFAIFSIAFLCLIGFNSCVVNSSVLFCAGSGRKRSPAGLNVDSLNLAADFFLQFSRCTSALHIKAFPSWLLHCCGQFIRACTQKYWIMNHPKWQENKSFADELCTVFTRAVLLLCGYIEAISH